MSDSAENCKGQTGALFGSLAPDYDPAGVFAYFGRRLVAMVSVEDGQRVLDVATGRGAVLLPAAERVGATGEVVGVDLAEGMVRAANEEAQRRGWGAPVRVMDAEQLAFPDAAFDRVLCGFSLMFFPHLDRALSEFRRVLRPGGRLAVSTWRVTPSHDLMAIMREMSIGRGTPAGSLNEPDAVARPLEEAGFTEVRVTAASTSFVCADVDQYWKHARSGAPRAALDALDDGQRERVQMALADRLRRFKRPGGIHVEATALLAVANR